MGPEHPGELLQKKLRCGRSYMIRIMCTKGIHGQVTIDTIDWPSINPQSTLDWPLSDTPCTSQSTLDWHLYRYSVDTKLAPNQHFDWHSIKTRLTLVCQLVNSWQSVNLLIYMSIDTWWRVSMKISQLSPNCWPRCQSTVNQVWMEMLIAFPEANRTVYTRWSRVY